MAATSVPPEPPSWARVAAGTLMMDIDAASDNASDLRARMVETSLLSLLVIIDPAVGSQLCGR
jgi:hypothetical protein